MCDSFREGAALISKTDLRRIQPPPCTANVNVHLDVHPCFQCVVHPSPTEAGWSFWYEWICNSGTSHCIAQIVFYDYSRIIDIKSLGFRLMVAGYSFIGCSFEGRYGFIHSLLVNIISHFPMHKYPTCFCNTWCRTNVSYAISVGGNHMTIGFSCTSELLHKHKTKKAMEAAFSKRHWKKQQVLVSGSYACFK